jgi:hypothetical protein
MAMTDYATQPAPEEADHDMTKDEVSKPDGADFG